jgi:hypothetical protein
MARDLHSSVRVAAESACDALQALLEARRDRICGELGEHPRPVAACDVHFNRLLEDRTGVCRALDALEGLRGAPPARIEDYLRSCAWLDEEEKRRLLSLLVPAEAAGRP